MKKRIEVYRRFFEFSVMGGHRSRGEPHTNSRNEAKHHNVD